MKRINNIILSSLQPSKNVIWLKNGVLRYWDSVWKEISGGSKDIVNINNYPLDESLIKNGSAFDNEKCHNSKLSYYENEDKTFKCEVVAFSLDCTFASDTHAPTYTRFTLLPNYISKDLFQHLDTTENWHYFIPVKILFNYKEGTLSKQMILDAFLDYNRVNGKETIKCTVKDIPYYFKITNSTTCFSLANRVFTLVKSPKVNNKWDLSFLINSSETIINSSTPSTVAIIAE